MKWELLEKYLKNSLTVKELDEVLLWIQNSKYDLQREVFLYQRWNNLKVADGDNNVNYKDILQKICEQIRSDKSGKLSKYKTANYFITLTRNVAVVLFLPVLGLLM